MTFILILTIILVWNLVPHLILWTLPIPVQSKIKASIGFVKAGFWALLTLVPDILAPIVVPFALLQTKPEDNYLPSWASWWDNDVSINGDQAEGSATYYAIGHDRRSFYARYVWLGLRNRASGLGKELGYKYTPGEYNDFDIWGDPKTGRDHEGWVVNRRGKAWQLYLVKKLGSYCLRINYGYKVWSGNSGDNRPIANVVAISFSILKWTGPQ